MENKGFSAIEIKDVDKGHVQAVFSSFNQIDSDGDVTLPGAFKDGAAVRISAYGHTSWQGVLPVGKGSIRTTKSEAILDGQFFVDTQAGKDTFQIIKAMGDLQEWSYGFDIPEDGFEFGQHDGKNVRFLKEVNVFEVSPVLIGAGVGTRTLVAKNRQTLAEQGNSVLTDVALFRNRAAEVLAMRRENGKELGSESRSLMEQIAAELEEFRALLTEPKSLDDKDAAFLQLIASKYRRL